MKDKKIGWIGTGIMGNPMARHLMNAGYTLNVYNRTKQKAAEIVSMGATWYDTPAEIAANSDVIITMIGFPKDVEECYFGEYGIFKKIRKGICTGIRNDTYGIEQDQLCNWSNRPVK